MTSVYTDPISAAGMETARYQPAAIPNYRNELQIGEPAAGCEEFLTTSDAAYALT
jgi:hypothetical protein